MVTAARRYWIIPAVLIVIILAYFAITFFYEYYRVRTDYGVERSEPTVEEGIKTWIKAFERYGDQTIHSIQQTQDDGYIAAGILGRNGTESVTGRQFADAYLLKLDSDGNITWEKTIGGNKGSLARDIKQTSDGGYIIVGAVSNYFDLGTEWDVYLVKTDASGNKTWEKAFDLFGMSNNDWAWSVEQTSDGGYIIGGWTLAYVGTRLDDAFLLKTDVNGNKLWEGYYGGTDTEDTRSAQQTSDGGYIIAGWTRSFNLTKPEDQNVYLVKTDASGNQLWEKTIDAFDKHEQDAVLSIDQTSDGGYILAGNTLCDTVANEQCSYLLKVDKDGNKIWENTYPKHELSLYPQTLYHAQQTSDGGYIAVGTSCGVYLLKVDADGNKMWEKSFGWRDAVNENRLPYKDYKDVNNRLPVKDVSVAGRSVRQTSDGGYVIAAEAHYPSNPWQNDAFLIKTDGNGNIDGYQGLKC